MEDAMATVHTHISVDLDAACSVWAARRWMGTAFAAFHPANWDGSGMGEDDVAVDLHAGGRGIKGEERDGRVHSCLALLAARHAPQEELAALTKVIAFVDAQDSSGNAVEALVPGISKEARDVLSATGLNAVLRARQAMVSQDDADACAFLGGILDGLLKAGRARVRGEIEADRARIFGGTVALVENAREYSTNGILFERGIRFVVYVDGLNLGIVRNSSEASPTASLAARSIVAGETDEWFVHPAGFLYCRGSRKSPARTPSKVDPDSLAQAIANGLSSI